MNEQLIPLNLDTKTLRLVREFEKTFAVGNDTRAMHERAQAALVALAEQDKRAMT